MFDVGPGFGKTMRLELQRSAGGLLTVQSSGYDTAGNRVDSVERVLRPGQSIEFTVIDRNSNILLGSMRAGCPLDSGLYLDAIQLRLRRVSYRSNETANGC
jgi:hypothetical protein